MIDWDGRFLIPESVIDRCINTHINTCILDIFVYGGQGVDIFFPDTSQMGDVNTHAQIFIFYSRAVLWLNF